MLISFMRDDEMVFSVVLGAHGHCVCGDNLFYEHSHEYDSVLLFFNDVGIVDMNNVTYISGVDYVI